MMQDNSEDKMFGTLLNDYSTPTDDNGFSRSVLNKLPRRRPLKAYFVSSGAICGGGFAAMQLPTLWRYVSGFKYPAIDIPKLDITSFHVTQIDVSSSPYLVMAMGLFLVMAVWFGGTMLLEDEM